MAVVTGYGKYHCVIYFSILYFFSREKCEKKTRKLLNARPNRQNVSILHYALDKNASWSSFLFAFSNV